MPLTKQPALREVGVIALVPDYWDVNWQTRHHVLTRLASYFYVVWMEPAHEWREALDKGKDTGPKQVDAVQWPGFIVYVPELWLPRFYRPSWLSLLTFQQRLRKARRLLIDRGCHKIVLYVWRPDFAAALSLIPFDLSCYHIDDEYTFSDSDLPLSAIEERVIADVNQVFIHSPGLLKKKGHLNPHTLFVPNGVDFRAFATSVREPPDLSPIPHPRIGYTGFIKRTLDWPLLLQLTLERPEWSFVFVGPVRPDPEVSNAMELLIHRRNVYFLEAKSREAIKAYPQHFDVCIMPYRMSDYTNYIYPLKLHEYLAGGRPSVSTRLRSLEEFQHVLGLAQTPEEWSDAISAALAGTSNTPSLRAKRQAVAADHDWNLLVRRIAGAMALQLGPRISERLQEAAPESESTQALGVS